MNACGQLDCDHRVVHQQARELLMPARDRCKFVGLSLAARATVE